MSLRQNPPALHPPLREQWSAELEAGVVLRRPVSDGTVVVAAANNHLIGFDAESGERRWDHAQPSPVAEAQALAGGPAIALPRKDGDVELLAYGWDGDERWRVLSGIGTGSDRMRGCWEVLVAVGVPLGASTRQVCRVYDAKTGERMAEFPCSGDPPHWVGGRFVYSEQAATGMGGLFVYDPGTGRTNKLHDAGASVRVVEDGIAVFDTTSDQVRLSRLVAVDLSSGQTLWEEPGGPNYSLAIGEGVVASVMAIDDSRVAMTLRELKTGKALWTAEAVEADGVAPVLAGDCVLGCLIGERMDVYDRAGGRRIQTLEEQSSLLLGGCLTLHGYVDARVRPRHLVGLAGGRA
jgi:outer membrane protein assembly factor BamB